MATKNIQAHQDRNPRQAKINRLLHFAELLDQALEIKQGMLVVFPFFLRAAIRRGQSKRAFNDLVGVGTGIVRQTRELSSALTTLGGHLPDELPLSWSEPTDPVSAFLYDEELATQILESCMKILEREWEATTDLKTWLWEHIETVLQESRQTAALLNDLFTTAEPRYRDRVMERFRIAALP